MCIELTSIQDWINNLGTTIYTEELGYDVYLQDA